MNEKISFTAYLKDEYSKRFEQMADKSEDAVKEITKDLDKLATTGKKVTRNIDELDKRISNLQRVRRFSLDTTTIRHASDEIRALQRERDNLENGGRGGGTGGFGLGRGFAIAGGALAIAGGLKMVADKATEATAKYQRYQAVLNNSMGSANARDAMNQIIDFASSTPFQVDELTDSFVKLRGAGFTPTMREMTALGDLASSKAKGFAQLSEALMDAETGEYERLKEFGIKAKTNGDKVSFTFNEQTTTISNTSRAIRDYILGLGQAKGITGSMAAISATTGGAMSNLEDNIDLAWKALGDRFKPEIDGSIGSLNSMIGTVRKWIEIPVSEQLQNETNKLAGLRVELGYTNITEARRKEILEEVKKIQPNIIDGTKSEAEQLSVLNGKLDEYIGKRKQQIAMERIKENFADQIADYQEGVDRATKGEGEAAAALARVEQMTGVKLSGSSGQQQMQARKILQDRLAKGQLTNKRWVGAGVAGPGSTGYQQSDEGQALIALNNAIKENQAGDKMATQNRGAMQKYNATVSALDKILGTTSTTATKPKTESPTGNTTVTGSNKGRGKSAGGFSESSISGGGRITNLQININNLVGGGVNIHSTTVREGAAKIKDHVVDALITAVNDANLAAGN